MNEDLSKRLESEGWKFMGNLNAINGSVYTDPIIRSFSSVVSYTLVQKTNVTYSLYVSKGSYIKAKECMDRLKEDREYV